MKQILFRAKRLDNGAWVEGFYSNLFNEPTNEEESAITFQIFEGADISYPYPTVNTVHAIVDEKTVCQFIREDTMHGKKTAFFCGDIVMLEMPYRAELLKAEIYYDNSACAFRAKVHMDGGVYIHWLSVLTVNSVIGNIFDNADLVSF